MIKVKIIETGEYKELSIIDPKSGCDWVADLMGNHGALPDIDEDGEHIMAQDDCDWWIDLIDRYQAADDRLHALYLTISGDDDDTWWREYGLQMDSGCDLDGMPQLMNDFCDSWEAGEYHTTIPWRDLLVYDDNLDCIGTLGDIVQDANNTAINHATIGGGKITVWMYHYIAADGEEPDSDTPTCNVDWSGFVDEA